MTTLDLLSAELAGAADPLRIEALAVELDAEIRRGDVMIGILPVDAEDVLLQAWRTQAETGGRDAVIRFVEHLYFRHRQRVSGEEAAAAVRRVLAEDDDDARAHVLAGWMHFQGFGLARDLEASLAHHRRAADLGEPDAMFELYVLVSTGQGCEPDEAAAIAWCERAAEHGHARAAYNLGCFYATGRGVDPDPALALAWYKRAGDEGHGRAAATAGVMLATGEGVPSDPIAAAEWLEHAEDLGFPVDSFLADLGVPRPE